MRLHCAEVLDHLRHKPVLMLDQHGMPTITRASDQVRKRLLLPLLPLIHQAHKFIFDSGSDQDERTVAAVRETTVAMLEAKLFHQPHRLIWIEDPYESNPESTRNYYLGIETDTKITVFAFNRANFSDHTEGGLPNNFPKITFHPFPLEIDLVEASDRFLIQGIDRVSPLYGKILGESIYSYKKLIVALNTVNIEIERVDETRRKANAPSQRTYDHRIIRIPLDSTPSEGGVAGISGHSKPRRKHLVRGYSYGKHTRSLAEQRWVQPYWRGNQEIGVVSPSHYEVR